MDFERIPSDSCTAIIMDNNAQKVTESWSTKENYDIWKELVKKCSSNFPKPITILEINNHLILFSTLLRSLDRLPTASLRGIYSRVFPMH